MTERDFTSEIARSIPWLAQATGAPAFYLKIPDAGSPGAANRFTAVKFFDAVLWHGGRTLALEAKLSKGPSLSFDALREVQEDALLAVEAAGGRGFILVNFRVTFSAKEAKRRGVARLIAAFAVPITAWVASRQEACRASLPLTWFEEHAIALPRIRLADGQAGYDLRALLGTGGQPFRPPSDNSSSATLTQNRIELPQPVSERTPPDVG
ncbi:MAG TPA: hypothetical protein VGO93_28670 [Candidatus Xenobia bacterium]